jgi:hypothetical protein
VHLAHREPGVERGAERREALHGERASMRLDATGSWPASNRKRPKDSSPRSTNPGGARGSFHPYGAEGLAAAVEVSACWQSLAVVWMDQTAGASAAGRVEAVPASCANNRAPTTEVGRDGVGAERGDEPGRVRRVELASPGPLGTRGRGSATRQGSDRDPLGACMTSTHSTIRPSARPQPSTVRQSRRPPGPPVTKTHFRQCDEQAFVGTTAGGITSQASRRNGERSHHIEGGGRGGGSRSHPNETLRGEPLPTISRIVPDMDVSTLDQNHVIPNMGVVVWRGIWFPLAFQRWRGRVMCCAILRRLRASRARRPLGVRPLDPHRGVSRWDGAACQRLRPFRQPVAGGPPGRRRGPR